MYAKTALGTREQKSQSETVAASVLRFYRHPKVVKGHFRLRPEAGATTPTSGLEVCTLWPIETILISFENPNILVSEIVILVYIGHPKCHNFRWVVATNPKFSIIYRCYSTISVKKSVQDINNYYYKTLSVFGFELFLVRQ